MGTSKANINNPDLKGRVKQKYGFLTGNYDMYEEGRKEVIEENEQNNNSPESDNPGTDSINNH